MTVKCGQCAMLVVIHPESGCRVEANQQFRLSGAYAFRDAATRQKSYVPRIACHAGRQSHMSSCDFRETDSLLRFIFKEIECDAFRDYEPGIGPDKLDEMNAHQLSIDLQKKFLALQESVFAWRQQQADRDQRFEQQIQALQQLRHNESMGIGKSQASGTNWQAVGTVVSAVAAVLACVVSAAALALQLWK